MEGTAVVKAVTSGDTVILQGRAANGPPPERSLSLSSLLAPKVARGPNGPEEVSLRERTDSLPLQSRHMGR